jgi:hypothetical protein
MKALITRMATANPLYASRHGALLKLGPDVAERTVSRLISRRRSLNKLERYIREFNITEKEVIPLP